MVTKYTSCSNNTDTKSCPKRTFTSFGDHHKPFKFWFLGKEQNVFPVRQSQKLRINCIFCFCLHQPRTDAAPHEVKVNANLETSLFKDNTVSKDANGTVVVCVCLVLQTLDKPSREDGDTDILQNVGTERYIHRLIAR